MTEDTYKQWEKNLILNYHDEIGSLSIIEKERISTAVTMSIKQLISSSDYFVAIEKSLSILGEAIDIDKICLFVKETKGNSRAILKARWSSDKNRVMEDFGEINLDALNSLSFILETTPYFYTKTDNISDVEIKAKLQADEIQGIILLKITVEDKFWGFLCFADCENGEKLKSAIIPSLVIFINAIESAIKRSIMDAELESAKIKAEEANEMKSQFISNMSHEIRTPLNAILGYTTLLEDYIQEDKAVKYLKAVQKAGNNLLWIISDILDLSKIEAGKLELQPEFIDVSHVLEEIKEIFTVKLEEKHLAMDMHIETTESIEVKLDEVRIRQILFNIIGNAVKFTESGNIDVKVQIIKQSDSIVTLKFVIADTGVGISEQNQNFIFEQFNQGGQSNKKYGGTGLGLAITKRLVEMMGGTIKVTSKVGKGSQFSIDFFNVETRLKLEVNKDTNSDVLKTISIKTSSSSDSSENIIEKIEKTNKDKAFITQMQGPKILVVDDLKENVEITCSLLEKNNFVTYTASSGKMAMDRLKTLDFNVDLILLDVMMPDLDGYELCKIIKSIDMAQRIPVIFLTARADTESIVKGLQCGAVDFIRKPLNPLEFIARIRTHIDLKGMREELEKIATIDKLTKLINKKEILNRINYEIVRFQRRSIKFAIILLEIDYFDFIKANFPSEFCDFILIKLAEILNSNLRKLDLPARWDNCKFIIVLPESDVSSAAIVAERIRLFVENQAFELGGIKTNVTITSAIKEYTGSEAVEEIIEAICSSLEKGKAIGGNLIIND